MSAIKTLLVRNKKTIYWVAGAIGVVVVLYLALRWYNLRVNPPITAIVPVSEDDAEKFNKMAKALNDFAQTPAQVLWLSKIMQQAGNLVTGGDIPYGYVGKSGALMAALTAEKSGATGVGSKVLTDAIYGQLLSIYTS